MRSAGWPGRQDRIRGPRRASAGRPVPDGQIFLPLNGHVLGQRPVNPGDALASLLLTIGVPARQIAPDPEARMAQWRDWLAARKLLLITSRPHLAAWEDAMTISLEPCPPLRRRRCWPGWPAGRGMGVGGGLEEWSGRFGRRRVAGLPPGSLRFAFYGRGRLQKRLGTVPVSWISPQGGTRKRRGPWQ